VLISFLPFALNLLGADFGSHVHRDVDAHTLEYLYLARQAGDAPQGLANAMRHLLTGSHTHTLLEWSAFMTALFTVVMTFVHSHIRRDDIATPIIGLAFFFAGCLDAFHALAANRLIDTAVENRHLIPFTWTVGRAFNILALIVGVWLIMWWQFSPGAGRRKNLRLVIVTGAMFGGAAYATIHFICMSPSLPRTVFPDSPVTRPWEMAPLILYALAGATVFRQFHHRFPNYTSHALLLSVVPMIAAQLHMSFGSVTLYDNDFNIALFLKVIAYAVLFMGMSLTYIRAYREQKSAVHSLEIEIAGRQEAAKSLRLFRSLIDQSSDAIFVVNPATGCFMDLNDRACASLGYTREELMGRNVSDIRSEAMDADMWRQFEKEVKRSGHKIIDSFHRRKDGGVFPVEVSYRYIELEEQRFFVAAARDVTERKASENALRQSEEKYRNIFENVRDVFFQIRLDGRIVEVSPSIERYSGYTREELLGQPVARFYPCQEERQRFMAVLLEKGEAHDFEISLQGKDSRVAHTSVNAHLRVNAEGAPDIIEGSLRDISERKAAAEALISAKNAAEQANRLKSEFLNTMSHELRTPLTTILGNVPLLTNPDDLPMDEKGRLDLVEITEIAMDIESSGRHLLTLINDLLDISKIEAGKLELQPQIVSVPSLMTEVAKLVRTQAEQKGIALTVETPDFMVDADLVRLKQILINLLSNAVKFTDEGRVAMKAWMNHDTACFQVTDTGCGISEADLPVIFDVFRQVDGSSTRKASGTGLGLAITRKLVELHGGAIEAQSAIGEGSVFTFSLPLAHSAG